MSRQVVEIGSNWSIPGREWSIPSNVGPFRPNSFQIWSISGRIWSMLVGFVPNLGNLCPSSTHFDRRSLHDAVHSALAGAMYRGAMKNQAHSDQCRVIDTRTTRGAAASCHHHEPPSQASTSQEASSQVESFQGSPQATPSHSSTPPRSSSASPHASREVQATSTT